MSSRTPSKKARFASVGALAVLAVVASTSPAQAREQFPGQIQEHLQLTCAPSCLLCHTSQQGGSATIKMASADHGAPTGYGVFVANLRTIGLKNHTVGSITATTESVVPWIDALEHQPCEGPDATDQRVCDSDGDGMPDIEELKAGRDPDKPGAGAGCPQYGCGASIATLPHRTSDTGSAAALIAGLGVGLVLARRYRR